MGDALLKKAVIYALDNVCSLKKVKLPLYPSPFPSPFTLPPSPFFRNRLRASIQHLDWHSVCGNTLQNESLLNRNKQADFDSGL